MIALQRFLTATGCRKYRTAGRLREAGVCSAFFQLLRLIASKCAAIAGVEQDDALARRYGSKPLLPLLLCNGFGLHGSLHGLLTDIAVEGKVLRNKIVAAIDCLAVASEIEHKHV